MVTFHLPVLTHPTSQFSNGTPELSEPVLARMVLLMPGLEPLSSLALVGQSAGIRRVVAGKIIIIIIDFYSAFLPLKGKSA